MTAADNLYVPERVERRFEPMARLFHTHRAQGLDDGAALCVYHHGRPVIDVWGGEARAGTPWREDTLMPLTSITKPILALALLALAGEGRLDIDAPVAAVWPEFAAAGKADVTPAHVLSHSAGLPVFDHPITLEEQITRKALIDQLVAAHPLWPPGTAHGYHAITFGFRVTEMLVRLTGLAPDAALSRLVSDPVGSDVSLGVPVAAVSRVAQTFSFKDDRQPDPGADTETKEYVTAMADKSSLLYRATFDSTAMTFEDMNDPRYLTTPRPAAYGTARGVARILASVVGEVDGRRLIAPNWMEVLRRTHRDGWDRVFCLHSRWGLGFLLPGGRLIPNLPDGAFGHLGSTGALAFAHPEAAIAFAFLPNRMKSIYEVPDRRADRLAAAIYSCLG